MGEFTIRSASAMNNDLQSVGSVLQRTSKLHAAAQAAGATVSTVSTVSTVPLRPNANGLAKPSGQRAPVAESTPFAGKFRTTISFADSGHSSRVSVTPPHPAGHVDRPPNLNVTAPATVPSSTSENKAHVDMKGLLSTAADENGSFDPPPPLKVTENGHTHSLGPTSPVEPQYLPVPQSPGLTNGVDSQPVDRETSQPGAIESYRFHIRELPPENYERVEGTAGQGPDEHPFAAARDVKQPDTYKSEKKIISAKGTVRGVRDRVRKGIAVFHQQKNDGSKNYRVVEKGKVVLFTSSMMIVRSTYEKCIRVKKILQTHMVEYEERDIFMSRDNQRELMLRLDRQELDVPQVFAEGQHLGGADDLTGLNESGELRKIFKHFKKVNKTSSCELCGGYRYIPCTSCYGSKKSLHRNHFTAEFCALRCIICDENGLVKCDLCTKTDTS